MASQGRDRRAQVLASSSVNGIDFVEVDYPPAPILPFLPINAAASQLPLLHVHFINAVDVRDAIGSPAITGGETIPSVPVLPIQPGDWGWDDGHLVLTLRVTAVGDFSNYTLTLPNQPPKSPPASTQLDRFFDHVGFSFKAGCPSDLDCQAPAAPCPPPAGDPPPIDYMAKDFLSFRQALLDFSTLRYPNWQERSEADFGVMFLEALSAIADELSYTQDRVAAEATLITATQRRSVQRHARLVNYEPLPPVSATTQLQFEVALPAVNNIPHGLAAIAPAPDGTPVTFETGLGLRDTSAPPPASILWNRGASVKIKGYWFDDSEQCLPAGATHMHVAGHGYGFQPGQMLLIETQPEAPGDPVIRQIVHLLQEGDPAGPWASEVCDELFPTAVSTAGPPFMTCPALSPAAKQAPAAVTRIAWQSSDQLTVARDLSTTQVIGNLTTATQGRTVSEAFVIGAPPAGTANPLPAAIERIGPQPLVAPGICGDPPTIYLYTLANAPLAWLPQPALDASGLPLPEIMLSQTSATASGTAAWGWTRNLLKASEFGQSFTIDPVSYRTVATNSDGSVQSDYDGDGGDTIRFGDGLFGANPDAGMQFTVTYRFGAGTAGNVAAEAIAQLDPAAPAAGNFSAVSNPLAASGGADAQTLQAVKRLAPQAFLATKSRAVLAADYAAAAQTLPWVKRAGTVFRWTGSWLTTFTTAEPVASEQIQIDDRLTLIELLNRYRMAGTESYVPDPDYVSIDLVVELCALPNAFAAQVEQGVTAALSPAGPGSASAFFAVSRFVFGQPLQRSALETAIQAVPGVAGVTSILYRLRGQTTNFLEMGDVVTVGASQILRCDNDPSRPNNGALAVLTEGGR
jgi:hypothetical protein